MAEQKDTTKKVRIAAIGDLHVRETSGGEYKDLFIEISQNADVLVLCGDLADHGLPEEAKVLADELQNCTIPVVGVLGNHDYEGDQHQEVAHILSEEGKVHVLDLEPTEIHGIGFAGVKGFAGGYRTHRLEPWGERIIKDFVKASLDEALKLESQLAKLRTEKKVVALHYSPIVETLKGEPPEIFAFLGSSRFLAPIHDFGTSVVFHAHAHYGYPVGKTDNGIPVYNASFPLMKDVDPKRPYRLIEL